jgi:thiopeptide-type bacteriocin biosynthesis protein
MYKIKNLFKEWYQPQESFVVRNPLFSVETFFNWKAAADNDVITSKETLRTSLREFYQQPLVQEALYVGSPDLHEQLLLWIENKIDKPDKKEKLELSLVKYMIRMCTRCTPYGLFASCTTGIFLDTTNIELSGKNSLQRFGRLDMDYVCELHSHLLKQKEICDQLIFYPNTSLYRTGDQWRYVEHRFKKETGRSYHLVQVDQSEYLEKIINAAKEGGTVTKLAATISDNDNLPDLPIEQAGGSQVSAEEAMDFIHELINNQVLINELEPSVTGEEYFSVVLRKLKTLQHTEKYVEHLEKVYEKFKLLKNTDGETKNTLYPEIVQELQQLEIPLHLKTLIQVDSYRHASCAINNKLGDELLKGASLLQLLTTDGSIKDSFTDFKTAFINRYEGQWVSLAEVLDTESGIGYGKFATSGMEESPLIDKLPIGNGAAAVNGQQPPDTESFKWQLYQQAIHENKTEVVIEDSIVETLSKKEFLVSGMPDSICMMAKIHAASAEDVDNGHYTITLQPPSGPSGGNLLGRFCHLHPEIEKLTRSTLEEEETHHPDAVFAEIVHLPESRIGNILMRPALRKYEIPYLCGTTLDKEFQIPVSDLLVGIEGNKVVIRSKRLNKEIIPRMTTAHNFSMTTLPVYQFLCDLQFQQIRSIGWQWGVLDNRPFLPRVSYGKYILSKAKWTLTKDEMKNLDQKNDETFIQQFTGFRKKKNLPGYVLLSQGDNELLLHLENIFCLKLLLAEVNKSETVILTESLDTPGSCWIKSPDGYHAGEFIFTFSRKKTDPVKNPVTLDDLEKEKNIERFFPVGSEWLYAKIYCGTKTAEKILVDVIKPFTEELLSKKIIDKFFFLRYHDTGQHIRIRFHKAGRADFWKKIIHGLQELLHPYMSSHQVYNLQFETYQREVERYGFDTMHLSEEIFFHQSVAVLNFISMLDGDEGEQYRWQVALKAVDLFLDGFHYTIEHKRDLIKMLDKSFAGEFNIKTTEQKKISERFSTHKQMVQLVMSDAWKENVRKVTKDSFGEDLKRAIPVFQIDNDSYIKCVEDIINASSVHLDIQQLNRLMPGYLHMLINRIFVSNQRKTELVIYDYLFRYYESKMVREKKANNVPEPLNVAG